MPFRSPNQQRQSTEGKSHDPYTWKKFYRGVDSSVYFPFRARTDRQIDKLTYMSQTQLTSCIVTHAGSRYARYTLSLVIYSSSLSQTSSSSLLISNAIICVSCFFYKFLITSIWPQHSMQLVYVYFCKYVLSMCTVIHKCNCDVTIWFNFFCHSIIHADLFSDVPKHWMFISLDYYRVPVHLNASTYCIHV